MPRKRWQGRVYLGRDQEGRQRFEWVGRYTTRRERDAAVAKARERLGGGARELPTVGDYLDRYLAEYGRRHKRSSHTTVVQQLARFRKEFADRPLDRIDRVEAKDWAADQPQASLPAVTAMFNHAIAEDDLPLARNPFRNLARRGKGRADQPPPTDQEFGRLLEACSVLGRYAPTMRALTRFAAFSLMRPSELYELEWADIDFDQMRVSKARRVYRGEVAEPKTGPKLIALTPPARDAIIGLPRESRLVFTSKTGRRLSASLVSGYWGLVLARARLEFDFYHATKHYGVHHLWTELNLSRRAIAAQAGWSLRTVDQMLAVYGHGDVGALEEIDAAFGGQNVVQLRDASEGAGS